MKKLLSFLLITFAILATNICHGADENTSKKQLTQKARFSKLKVLQADNERLAKQIAFWENLHEKSKEDEKEQTALVQKLTQENAALKTELAASKSEVAKLESTIRANEALHTALIYVANFSKREANRISEESAQKPSSLSFSVKPSTAMSTASASSTQTTQ